MTAKLTDRPLPTEYGNYYESYIAEVPRGDVLDVLRQQIDDGQAFFADVPDTLGPVVHPPYTWSVAEVVGHLADSERVFGYRAMRIARSDQTPLPGFDENAFVQHAHFNECPLRDIIRELTNIRLANLDLFHNLQPEAWTRCGTANGVLVSVRAVPYIIAGHTIHHMGILKSRLGGINNER